MKKISCILFTLLIFSCSAPVKEVVIDNPSAEAITVEFDNNEIFNLEPGEFRTISLKFGKRTISVNNQAAEEIILDEKKNYLINPLRETYYVQTARYFESERASDRYYENHYPEKSTIEGIEVGGEYKKVGGEFLIKKNWDFGLDREMSPELSMKSAPIRGHITARKIHRKQTLVDEIMEEFSRQLKEELSKKE